MDAPLSWCEGHVVKIAQLLREVVSEPLAAVSGLPATQLTVFRVLLFWLRHENRVEGVRPGALIV